MSGGHDHSHRGANKKRMAIALGLTSAYLIAEVIGAIVTRSLALLADAGHMLTDVAGIALALFAMRFAEKPATPERTYGYHRVEIVAALANAVTLILISLYVLYEAVLRFRTPVAVAGKPMLFVAAIGLVVNLIALSVLRGGSQDSLNMKGAYFEVLSDMLTSVGVIIAAVVVLTTGWTYIDPLVSAGIGLFIFPRTWRLLKEAVGVLLEGTPADVNITALREAMASVAGVSDVHDLHVWSLTSGVNAMSAHVVQADGAPHDVVRAAVRARVASDFKIAHVTLQVEASACGEEHLHL